MFDTRSTRRPAGNSRLVALFCGLGLSTLVQAQSLTAREVMERVDQRYDGDSFASEVTMVLIDRRERQRSRELLIYSKDYGEDRKTLARFLTPADIAGTSYLNHDWEEPDRDDDSWLYLPALQRVKRLASSDTSDSFLGSDFSFADINGLELDWYDYEFVTESEIVDGHDTWVIDVLPRPEMQEKAEDATGYSRLRTWIIKDNYVQLRAQAWELRGNRIKYFTSDDIELIDGIWTVRRLQAISTRNGRQEHASILQMNDIDYNVDLDDDLFSTEALQRGLD